MILVGSPNKGLKQHFPETLRAMLNKVFEIASFIMIVRFIMILSNPRTCDGAYLTLFQRIFFSISRGRQWCGRCTFQILCWASLSMSPENVALSLYLDPVLMLFDAVKTSISWPASVNVFVQLRSRSARLKIFFTAPRKTAPCVLCANIPAAFWPAIDNNIYVQRDVFSLWWWNGHAISSVLVQYWVLSSAS